MYQVIFIKNVSAYIVRTCINTEFNVALESSEGLGVSTVGGGILQRVGAVVLIGAHRSLSLSLFTPFVPVLSLKSQTGRLKAKRIVQLLYVTSKLSVIKSTGYRTKKDLIYRTRNFKTANTFRA